MMKKCLVTGAAGFIGSHLCEALLGKGLEVIGIDAFIPYYPRQLKEQNLARARSFDNFSFHELDIRTEPFRDIINDCEVVFHLAAMAGLMKSWTDYQLYSTCNELATKNLLETLKDRDIKQFIYVSTSSVYGKEATGPEDSPLSPCSPYGITKLAAEHLCRAYSQLYDIPLTILRYFSVYGPRQRPDMGYNILIKSIINQTPFPVYGDGEQTRSNTYISDCIKATLLAYEKPEKSIGETFNIGGGEIVSLNQVIGILEDILGKKAILEHKPSRPGDQKHTAANVKKAISLLNYNPTTRIHDGLKAEIEWICNM